MRTYIRYLFGGESSTSRMSDIGRGALRVFTGLALAFGHGLGKLPPSERFIDRVADMGFPFAAFFAWAAGLSEFAGGLLLAAGLLTRPTSLFLDYDERRRLHFTRWRSVWDARKGDPIWIHCHDVPPCRGWAVLRGCIDPTKACLNLGFRTVVVERVGRQLVRDFQSTFDARIGPLST